MYVLMCNNGDIFFLPRLFYLYATHDINSALPSQWWEKLALLREAKKMWRSEYVDLLAVSAAWWRADSDRDVGWQLMVHFYIYHLLPFP